MPCPVPDAADAPDLAGVPAWIVTDGKAGDENQCLGIAEALGLDVALRRIPRRPLDWSAPWGPLDPRDAPGRVGGALAGPPPRLLIASGRRAVPYLRAMRRGTRVFTAFLKDPRTGCGTADFLWVPEHDDLRGDNVVATLTGPHRVSAERLAAARAAPDPRLAALPSPRVAVLVGGDSRHGRYGPRETERLVAGLSHLAGDGAALMVTVSRRTPALLATALRALCAGGAGFFWDGTDAAGENPYLGMLALADAIVVTSDSANMVGEAAASGAPLLLFELPTTYIRHGRFFDRLADLGVLRPFTGCLESVRYTPIDATPAIASALARAYARHRARHRGGDAGSAVRET